jgi:hypothetical protein
MNPARTLAWMRIAIGAIFLLRTTPLLAPFGFRFTQVPLVGWPEPGFRVSLLGLPAWLVAALAIARTIAALSFTIGYRARIAGVIATTCGYLALSTDALGYVNSLHLLFLATLVLALVDARSMKTSVWLVRALPLSVYVFSAIAKLNAQFLSGDAIRGFCEDRYIRGPIASLACPHARAMSITTIVAEMTLPIVLAIPRTRRVAIFVALGFHLVVELAMHPDVFGWVMAVLLASFAINASEAP